MPDLSARSSQYRGARQKLKPRFCFVLVPVNSHMNILYSELLSQSYQVNAVKNNNRIRGSILCDSQYLNLSFEELHYKYKTKSMKVLQQQEGLEESSRSKEATNSERGSSFSSIASAESNVASNRPSPFVKSKKELMEAVVKHTDYLKNSYSSSNMSLQFI